MGCSVACSSCPKWECSRRRFFEMEPRAQIRLEVSIAVFVNLGGTNRVQDFRTNLILMCEELERLEVFRAS